MAEDNSNGLLIKEQEEHVIEPVSGKVHIAESSEIPFVEKFDEIKHNWIYSPQKYSYASIVFGLMKQLKEFKKEKIIDKKDEVVGFRCKICGLEKVECSEDDIDICVDCAKARTNNLLEQENTPEKSKEIGKLLDKVNQDKDSKKKELNYEVHIIDAVEGMATFLEDNSVNLFLVDPPYNVTKKKTDDVNPEDAKHNYKHLHAPKGDWDYFETEEDFQNFTDDWVNLCHKKSTQNGSILIHATIHNLFVSKIALEKAGYQLRQVLIWHVLNASPSLTNRLFRPVYEFILWGTKGGGYTFNNTKQAYVTNTRQIENLISVPFLNGKERVKGHPTQKPSQLLRILIRTLSNKEDLVCDCFLGSGSTMLSCKKENRSCIGFEKREECISMIKQKVGWGIQPLASEYKVNHKLKVGGEKKMEEIDKLALLQDLDNVIQIKRNKIYHGDCIKGLSMMADNCVDGIITDPPYGMNYESNAGKEKKFSKIENDDNLDFFEPFIKEAYRVMKDNSCIYVFCRFDCYSVFYDIMSKYFSIKNCLVWQKSENFGGLGDIESSYLNNFEFVIFAHKGRKRLWEGGIGRKFGLIEDKSLNSKAHLMHPTQKPVEILRQFITDSTNKGDLIVDAFSGSGSTLIASIREERDFIGFELNQEFCETIEARVQDESKKLSNFFETKEQGVEKEVIEKQSVSRDINEINNHILEPVQGQSPVQNQKPIQNQNRKKLNSNSSQNSLMGFAKSQSQFVQKSDIPEDKINEVIEKYNGMLSREEAIERIKRGDD